MDTVIKRNDSVVLDETDLKILKYLARGDTAKDIKGRMRIRISERTIESRIARMKEKYVCRNVTHLIATLLRVGIIK